MNKAKKILGCIFIFICVIATFSITYAMDVENIKVSNYTIEYKKWIELDDNEKENVITPLPYASEYVEKKQNVESGIGSMFWAKLGVTYSEKYDLRDYINIDIVNQAQTQQCWAVATNRTIETNVAKLNGVDRKYSIRYLEYATSKTFLNDVINQWGYDREVGKGGNPFIALGFYTSGKGPILEKDMPFENNENKISIDSIQNKEVVNKIEEYEVLPSIYKSYDENGNITYHNGQYVEYSEEDVKNIRKQIKKHIMQNGALFAYTYTPNTTSEINQYYCKANTNYYQSYVCKNEKLLANHAVTIIGWDDNYPIENFNEDNRPKNPGAYIVANSYGDSIFENGVFYISYEDYFIETTLVGINSVSDINYDSIYQHDELGMNTAIISSKDFFGANIFKRNDTSKTEYLTQISIATMTQGDYEIYINSKDTNLDINNMKKVATITDAHAGYHTIDLDEPVLLTGNQFVVAFKQIGDTGDRIVTLEGKDSSFWSAAENSENESFISHDGENWTDIVEYANIAPGANLCIKAFTQYEENEIKVTGINLDKEKLVLKVEENAKLIPSILPNNATNKIVTWTSSDTNVATVDANGKVVAKSKGTAVITVKTVDGAYTATCTVTVIQPVSKVSLNNTKLSLKVGENKTLIATIEPSNASNTNKTWISSDTNVATVDANGKVVAKSKGTAVITVKTVDGAYTATCTVTVIQPVLKVSLNKTKLTLKVGENQTLTATIEPSNASNTNKIWTSSNTNVATVDEDGNIMAKSVGTTTITVTTLDGGYTAKCLVTVENNIKDIVIKSDKYAIAGGFISKIDEKTDLNTFKKSIECNVEYDIYKTNGEKLKDKELIGTNMIFKANNHEYKIIVNGDLNGDGEITLTDLSKVNLHILNIKLLTDSYLKAADVNDNRTVTLTDLSKINLHILNIRLITNS